MNKIRERWYAQTTEDQYTTMGGIVATAIILITLLVISFAYGN